MYEPPPPGRGGVGGGYLIVSESKFFCIFSVLTMVYDFEFFLRNFELGKFSGRGSPPGGGGRGVPHSLRIKKIFIFSVLTMVYDNPQNGRARVFGLSYFNFFNFLIN